MYHVVQPRWLEPGLDDELEQMEKQAHERIDALHTMTWTDFNGHRYFNEIANGEGLVLRVDDVVKVQMEAHINEDCIGFCQILALWRNVEGASMGEVRWFLKPGEVTLRGKRKRW
jgi:hypothetical protein